MTGAHDIGYEHGDGSQLQVSVVIGVRNGGAVVEDTIRSVCSQGAVNLECIVVDDGSNDDTAERITELACVDRRLRLFRQRPSGLTRALMLGCAEARSPLIARIDAGDEMLAGRLACQVRVLGERDDICVLGGQLRERGARGESLGTGQERVGVVTDLTSAYRSTGTASLTGLAHMSVCFRAGTYRRCGGYRAAFALAQDVDLWSRMAQFGAIARLEQVQTVSRIAHDGLSTRHHKTQLQLRRIAAAAASTRARGADEASLLAQASQLSQQAVRAGGSQAAAAYHVASRLAQIGEYQRALQLYGVALRREPLNLRHLGGYLRARLTQSRSRSLLRSRSKSASGN